MKINIIKRIVNTKQNNDINIIIEGKYDDKNIAEIIQYVKKYKRQKNDKVMVDDGYFVKEIYYHDIILFYGENNNTYCKTKERTYKIKSKLYELENIENFIRISKKSIVNIEQVECFDISKKGVISVKLKDGTEETVARRRIKKVLEFLDGRRI